MCIFFESIVCIVLTSENCSEQESVAGYSVSLCVFCQSVSLCAFGQYNPNSESRDSKGKC